MIPQSWKVKADIGNERFEFDSDSVLLIDRANLDEELAKQAAWYARFAVLYERVQQARLEAEAALEEEEAEHYGPARLKLGKGATEKAVTVALQGIAELRALRRKILKMRGVESDLKVMVNAFVQRHGALVALARTRNYELSMPSPAEVDKAKRHLGLH